MVCLRWCGYGVVLMNDDDSGLIDIYTKIPNPFNISIFK